MNFCRGLIKTDLSNNGLEVLNNDISVINTYYKTVLVA